MTYKPTTEQFLLSEKMLSISKTERLFRKTLYTPKPIGFGVTLWNYIRKVSVLKLSLVTEYLD